MPQRHPSDVRDQSDQRRSSFGTRLQRNQPGIIVAVGLTIAAAVVLLSHYLD